MPPYYTASDSTQIWLTWTDATTTTAGTTMNTWNFWTADGTGDTWSFWIDSTVLTTTGYFSGGAVIEPTAEQREQERCRREDARQARERARQLLLDALTAKQRREFEADGCFHVVTKNGTRRYRLAPGSSPQRVRGEDGRRYSYCIHPVHSYPAEDVVLAHKLLLEADEERFLQIANASRLA